MERCPCCNARLRQQVVCQRCGSDFAKALAAEQSADAWIRKAVRDWQQGKAAQSLNALQKALLCKQSEFALLLRDHVVDQLSRQVLELLAQQRVLEAKKRLYPLGSRIHQFESLRQLNAFTDFLLIRTM